jgi:hypothetical protein
MLFLRLAHSVVVGALLSSDEELVIRVRNGSATESNKRYEEYRAARFREVNGVIGMATGVPDKESFRLPFEFSE